MCFILFCLMFLPTYHASSDLTLTPFSLGSDNSRLFISTPYHHADARRKTEAITYFTISFIILVKPHYTTHKLCIGNKIMSIILTFLELTFLIDKQKELDDIISQNPSGFYNMGFRSVFFGTSLQCSGALHIINSKNSMDVMGFFFSVYFFPQICKYMILSCHHSKSFFFFGIFLVDPIFCDSFCQTHEIVTCNNAFILHTRQN